MSKKLLRIFYVFMCTMIILVKESYCYLDSSAMTYLLQTGIIIGLTITTSVGVFFYKLKRKLGKNNIQDDDDDDDDDDE